LLQIGAESNADEPVDQKRPDDMVARLRRRAAEHHRSLQGELLSILEKAAYPSRPLTRLTCWWR